jgi:SAM-dependent methyltransferase
VCSDRGPLPFVTLAEVPVYCNVLWPTREEALAAPRARVQLVLCPRCGMTWNAAFDASLLAYSPAYENSLHFSAVFEEYAQGLAARLVERHDLRGKDVLEIGSGKGEFLRMLCRAGGNRGVGFDPSHEGPEVDGALRFVRELYSDAHADVPADFVCCRHVLEHVERPVDFLAGLRRALGRRDAILYFEVPAAEYLLTRLSGWDIIYEHCSSFSMPALRRAFAAAGFETLDTGFSFGEQYLWLEARPGSEAVAPAEGVGRLTEAASGFGHRFAATIARWSAALAELPPQSVAVWGAGSKGVTFANLVDGGSIGCVVDVNPRKHGRFVPGTGHSVISPAELAEREPAAIVAMNPLYTSEITASARASGVVAEVLVA